MVDVKHHLKSISQSLNPKLTRLWIETTDLCNSRCKTCFIWKNTESKRCLDYEVLGNPLFKNVRYILNSGGEPSLCDLEKILLTEHRLLPKATLQVSTNGLLPERVLYAVNSALAAGARIDVGISLDGIGKVHDNFRGVPGNFDKVNFLVEKLGGLRQKYGCLNVTVGSTLTAETVAQKQALYSYVKKNQLEFIWHWPNRSSFYGNEKEADFVGAIDKEAFIQAVYDVTPAGLYRDSWINYLNGKALCFDCYALRGFLVLRCNGDLVPCLTHWNVSIGNVLTGDPQKIWYSACAKAIIKYCRSCGVHGCLNSWGYGWSLEDKYFPLLKAAINRRLH
jgi:MoaA/NifB/PqqE/SkfB family radical SAM enzyme